MQNPKVQTPDASTSKAGRGRKKLAIITTIWRYLSHAQHMGDRFLVGYPWEGRWHHPNIDVVSCYVDQIGSDDQSAERAKSFGFTVYPTIAQALRCGGATLAVDAVLIIGEHGSYPRNHLGQILYPRYEFFKQTAEVFEQDGRSVPVFNDKHLSYSFAKAREMVETARRLKAPLLAGSSLPVTWRLPSVDLPMGAVVDEALMVGVGESDAMDYHALEAMQCMLERRKGGETGVKTVEMIVGDAVWKAGDEGRWSKALLSSALSRSPSLRGSAETSGRTQDYVATGEVIKLVDQPAAYFIEYRDGTRATLLMLNGALRDYVFAARLKGQARPLSTHFVLPPNPNVAYSACLMHQFEEMIETGIPPYPVERTMLVCGILENCLKSKASGRGCDTPELSVRYRPPSRSTFCQS